MLKGWYAKRGIYNNTNITNTELNNTNITNTNIIIIRKDSNVTLHSNTDVIKCNTETYRKRIVTDAVINYYVLESY